jgi:hypothetical protein
VRLCQRQRQKAQAQGKQGFWVRGCRAAWPGLAPAAARVQRTRRAANRAPRHARYVRRGAAGRGLQIARSVRASYCAWRRCHAVTGEVSLRRHAARGHDWPVRRSHKVASYHARNNHSRTPCAPRWRSACWPARARRRCSCRAPSLMRCVLLRRQEALPACTHRVMPAAFGSALLLLPQSALPLPAARPAAGRQCLHA